MSDAGSRVGAADRVRRARRAALEAVAASRTIESQDVGRLGHSRIAVTLEVYTAGDERSRREAISKLADLFGSQTG